MTSNPWHILFNVITTTFLCIFSATLTIISDNAIQGELALSISTITWVTTLYFLGANSIVPASNRLAERYGYRNMYLIGIGIFTLGSGLSGLAPNFPILGLARYIEGLGSGIIFPTGLALITHNFPKEKLSLAINLYLALGFGLGLGLGMPLSGYFTQFFSWRIPFFLMIPCGILAMIGCRNMQDTAHVKTAFDLWGLLFFALFVSALVVALANGQLPSTTGGWTSPFILGCFALSLIGLLATIAIDLRHPEPILPLKLFKIPMFSVSCVSVFLLGMAVFASLTVSSEYLIDGHGTEKFVAGSICLIYGLLFAVSAVVASQLMRSLPAPLLTLIGLSGLIGSYYWNNILSLQTGWKELMEILALRGVSLGLALGPATAMGIRFVPPEFANRAATQMTFFRQVGGTFAGTVLTILLIRRRIFHAARFGEQINDQLPAYKVTMMKLEALSTADPNGSTFNQAQSLIIQNVETQAYITALNDSLLVFAYVTIVVALLIAALSCWEWYKHREDAVLPDPPGKGA